MKPMPPQSSGILNRIKKQNSINRPMPNLQQAAQAVSQQSPVDNLGNRMGSVINNRVPSQNFQRLRSMVNNQTPQQTQPANAVAEANAYADQLLAQDRMINLENMTSGRMGSGGGSALISPEEQQNREIEANKNRQRQIEDAERRSAAMQQAVSPEQRSNLESQQLINNQIKKINRSNFGKIGF